MSMKAYKELMKEIQKDEYFEVTKSPRKSTVKVVYTKTGRLYSVHPGDNAVNPLRDWMKKIKLSDN